MRRFIPLMLLFFVVGCGKPPEPTSLEFRFAERHLGKNLTAMTVKGGEDTYYLRSNKLLTEEDVASATVFKEVGGHTIKFEFTSRGSLKYRNLTKRNTGRLIAVVANGELISAQLLQKDIPTDEITISGNLTRKEASRIVKGLGNLKS